MDEQKAPGGVLTPVFVVARHVIVQDIAMHEAQVHGEDLFVAMEPGEMQIS
jgi:hypothetical protein